MLEAPVLVVGGGPAGLAVAACLRQSSVDFVMVDRDGTVGGAYRTMYPETELLSPAKYTVLPGMDVGAEGKYISASQYFEYLHRFSTSHDLNPIRATVDAITPVPQGLDVQFRGVRQVVRYKVVVLATGIFDHPVVPDVPGLEVGSHCPRVIHSRDWQGPESYEGRRILVIGAGMSGVEIAEQCAQAGLQVLISSRGRIRLWRRRVLGIDVHHFVHLISHRLPRWFAGSYCRKLPPLGAFDRGFRAGLGTGMIQRPGAVVKFQGDRVEFVDGTIETVDVVVLATGYRWAPACLPVEAETGNTGHPLADNGRVRGVPGLYVIGAPCGRILPSEFLRGVALDAPVIAREIASVIGRTA
ncbi:MAG: NAD(P)-binding domain-containing protein [Planctomycetales bacterium]|nr:NAD(P)-binding domain-containing protein [Planctomycetales bacterium]